MNFTDPSAVWSAVYSMQEASWPRARNRAKINALFNGDPPFTEKEVEENSIGTNVNFLEGTEIIQRARSQFNSAFMRPSKFFNVTIDVGPAWKRREWGTIITNHLNRIMKRSPRYYQTLQDQYAGVVLHGVGPVTWFRDRDWCPKAHGIDDIMIPSGTLRDFSNLGYFAIYTRWTLGELWKQTHGQNVDRGWKMPVVNQVLEYLRNQLGQSNSLRDLSGYQHPEKVEEDWKENSGFYSSDAAPSVYAYDFYYWCEDGDQGSWRRKIILDKSQQQLPENNDTSTLIFDGGKRSYGEEVSRIIHCQYADGAVKPPFRYHSIRSLGYLLYAVTHLQNRVRCKFNDAVFESMMWLFRTASEGDGERIRKVDLHHCGVIPDGLTWVPPNERPVLDPNLVGMALQLNKQLMAEHSSSYVQDVDSAQDPGEPETATAVMARVENSNAMIGAMLTDAFTYERYKQQEIARRFATIDHKECKRFRELCVMEGVPPEVFKMFDAWEITPERTLGNGNRTVERAQAQALMGIKDMAEVPPRSKSRIVQLYVSANTDDPSLAREIAPDDEAEPSSAAQMATLAWGTLIDGKPVVIAEAVHPIEYIQTLMVLLDQDLQRIEAAGGTPPLDRILGLSNVIEHLSGRVQQIAVDPNLKPVVKQFNDALKNAQNLVKAYVQRFEESMKDQQQQGDPEAMAKIQALLISAESKARISEDGAAQKRRHAEMKFVQDEKRKNEAAQAELQRKAVMTAAEVQVQRVKTRAEIANQRDKVEADIEAKEEMTEASIEARDHESKAGIVRTNREAANQPKPKTAKKK